MFEGYSSLTEGSLSNCFSVCCHGDELFSWCVEEYMFDRSESKQLLIKSTLSSAESPVLVQWMDGVTAEVVMRKDGVIKWTGVWDGDERFFYWSSEAPFIKSVIWSCLSVSSDTVSVRVQEKIEHSVKLLMNLFFLPFRHWRTNAFEMGWDGRIDEGQDDLQTWRKTLKFY